MLHDMYYQVTKIVPVQYQETPRCDIIAVEPPQEDCSKMGLISFCTGVVLAVLGLLLLA